jgi:predicted phage-related endonuclease
MKIISFKDEKSWEEARMGRITGTKLKGLVNKRGGDPKIQFYELIAERICIPATEEGVMDRGKRLEDEAMEKFAKETGKKVNNELVIWCRDDNENIAVSPDGSVGKTEAIEVKCLSSARHIEAFLTKQIPSEYEFQVLQYFITNDQLKKLYLLFYDPRMPKELFWLEVNRKDKKVEIKEYLELERETLKQIEGIEKQIVF